MGNLFTRALKRFTQCSNRNQLPSHEQQEVGTSQQEQDQQSRPIVQSIPVGQSIDSADYAAFESAKSSQSGLETRASEPESRRAAVTASTIEEEDEDEKMDKENELLNGPAEGQKEGEQSKPEVEEAVIKIQAFVRGHLTRKALKDAQQQAASPAPNALGQSQFDQESLMKSPPSAVFAMSAPPGDLLSDQINRPAGSSRVAPLESIAEDVELSGAQATSAALTNDSTIDQGQRRKMSPISRSLAISSESRADSVSPVPSEANASIDLGCDTPASASIDILDHNIRPVDALASVLHPKLAPPIQESQGSQAIREAVSSPRMVVDPPPPPAPAPQQSHNDNQSNSQASQQTSPQSSTSPSVQNSHSIDSAEAAAIRIQSAYRGYHTRKHSPYRRRSPGGLASSSPPSHFSLDSGLSNGQAARRSPLRQQNATVALDDLIDEELELELEPDAMAGGQEERLARLQGAPARRASRQRHRLDTDDSQRSDSAATQAAALEGATSTTIDEPSNDTCVSMVAMDSADAPTANPSSRVANLTRADNSSPSGSPQPSNEDVKMSIDQNVSLEMDTESSNLGAALSMNDDFSDREAISSMRQQGSSPDERASEVQRFVDQLVNDDDDDDDDEQDEDNARDEEEELEKATDQLEAALEEATEDEEGRDRVAESLANAILDEEEQRTIELESDDIERRDPRGQRSEDRPKSPAISTQDTQPALVSGGSLEEQHEQQPLEGAQNQQQRLGIDSPDEAIGSGRSSPALVSSNPGSSDEEDENEDDDDTKAGAGAGQTGDKRANQAQQTAPAGNKNRKKNRNRKKGRK